MERRLDPASRKEKAKVQSSEFSFGLSLSLSRPLGRARAPGRSLVLGVEETQTRLPLPPSSPSSLLFLFSPLPLRGRLASGGSSPPHTTVLTDGSDKLSWPVMSVGGYCCGGGERQGGEGRGAEFGEGDTRGSHVWSRAAGGFSLSVFLSGAPARRLLQHLEPRHTGVFCTARLRHDAALGLARLPGAGCGRA